MSQYFGITGRYTVEDIDKIFEFPKSCDVRQDEPFTQIEFTIEDNDLSFKEQENIRVSPSCTLASLAHFAKKEPDEHIIKIVNFRTNTRGGELAEHVELIDRLSKSNIDGVVLDSKIPDIETLISLNQILGARKLTLVINDAAWDFANHNLEEMSAILSRRNDEKLMTDIYIASLLLQGSDAQPLKDAGILVNKLIDSGIQYIGIRAQLFPNEQDVASLLEEHPYLSVKSDAYPSSRQDLSADLEFINSLYHRYRLLV